MPATSQSGGKGESEGLGKSTAGSWPASTRIRPAGSVPGMLSSPLAIAWLKASEESPVGLPAPAAGESGSKSSSTTRPEP